MAETIEHLGTVENIDGSHIRVRIIQTTACASCSVKGHCSSADSKEKIVDITLPESEPSTHIYKVGESVRIEGSLSLGMKAVLLAFVLPFIILVSSLFVFMHLFKGDELLSSGLSLALMSLYYFIVWLNKAATKKIFSFTIKPINN